MPKEVQNTEVTTKRRVSCSGYNAVSSHPKVYLDIPPGKTEVVCPYCSKKFVLEK